MRGVWCQALSLPRQLVNGCWQPGPSCPFFPGADGVGVGTQNQPHRVHSCELALRASRMARGHPRGRVEAPRSCEGPPRIRRFPSPGCPPVGRVARARRSLAVCVWGCRPSAGRGAGCGYVWVRGGAPCSVVTWCVVLPLVVCRSCAPLSLYASCCCACRGAVACGHAPFPACAPCSFASPALLARCPSSSLIIAPFFHPFLYPLLVGPPAWRAFFPVPLASLCVARLFPLPTSSFCWSSLSSVAKAFHLHVPRLPAPSWFCETWTGVWAVAGLAVMTTHATATM